MLWDPLMERKPFYASASPFGGGTDSARAQGPPVSPARDSTDIPSPGTLRTPSPGSVGAAALPAVPRGGDPRPGSALFPGWKPAAGAAEPRVGGFR